MTVLLNYDTIITMEEHPNEPILEAILLSNDEHSKNTAQLLEHLLEQADSNRLDPILEAQLVVSSDGFSNVVQAIKDIPVPEKPEKIIFPEIKIPEYPKEIKVSNQIELSSLEDKVNQVKEAILNKEDKDIDLSEVINVLKDIRDKEDPEIDIPDLSSKIDELITVIKEGNVTEVNESDEINYTEKFDTLIKEIKKIAKQPDFGHSFAVVDIRNRAGTQINPATEEKQDSIITAIEAIPIGLTDSQLRASPVPVDIGATSVTINASDIEIGAVEIKNSTTDDRVSVINSSPTTEYGLVVRNIPSGTQDVSIATLPAGTNNIGDVDVLTLPNTSILATAVDATTSGDNTIVAVTNTPRLYYISLSANGANSADVTAIVKIGASTKYKVSLKAGAIWSRNIGAGRSYVTGSAGDDIVVNLSAVQTVHVSVEYSDS